MFTRITRRSFFAFTSSAVMLSTLPGGRSLARGGEVKEGAGVPETFPSQDPALVREVVGASHANIDRVRELVTAHPELAKAAQDWGFGDWESALGAASHMGRRDIAELLMEHGARPDLFTFAMLGQLAVVQAFIAGSPGIQRLRGPHGFSLLHHARVGGEKATPVVRYLEELGDADPSYTDLPLSAGEKAAYLGSYVFGKGEEDRFEILLNRRGSLAIQRGAYFPRALLHQGDHRFHPGGALSVRITFSMKDGRATALKIQGSTPAIEAVRVAAA